MIKKKEFIDRIIQITRKDLMRILPKEGFLNEMYYKLKEYLRRKYNVYN